MRSLSKHVVWRGRIARYAPLLLWICVIFFLSSSMGAANNTSRIIRPLLLWLFPDITEPGIQAVHYYVRKAAHLSEYAMLGILAARAFKNSSVQFLSQWRFPLAVLLVSLIATADEINQSFLTSRTGQPQDVLLDITGGATAIIIFYLIVMARKKRSV
jgi:VanZ family protein